MSRGPRMLVKCTASLLLITDLKNVLEIFSSDPQLLVTSDRQTVRCTSMFHNLSEPAGSD